MSDLPKGFACKTCGTEHKYPAYVYAHWSDTLVHTCDHCGARHDIRRGIAIEVQVGKKKETAK